MDRRCHSQRKKGRGINHQMSDGKFATQMLSVEETVPDEGFEEMKQWSGILQESGSIMIAVINSH